MNSFFKLTTVLTGLSLCGCSYIYSEDGLIKDTTYEYLNAQQEKQLVIPEDLKHKNSVDYMAVPNIGEQAKQAPVGKDLNVTAPVQILAVLENTRADKQSKNPAVFITDDLNFLWGNLTNLFKDKEIELARIDQEKHLIETGWLAQNKRGVWLGLENIDEVDDFKTQYTIQILPGMLKNEYRIEVERTHAQILDDETDEWKSIPNFWHDSTEMLNFIIGDYDQRVADRDEARQNRVVAGFKVELSRDEAGNAALVTKTESEDVWSKLPEVLESLGFEINDRDHQVLTYFAEFKVEEEGFFASLFDEEQQPLKLEPGNYQISVSSVGEMTAITFKDGQGVALPANLITQLYPDLSARFGGKN